MQNIFLVEDDANFGSVLKSYLELNNFTVVWINDGKNAIRRFKEEKFNIGILDIMLPNIDGLTLVKDMKLIDKNIPIIFLTAKTLKEDIIKGYKTGADEYITKPFDSEVLLLKINAILNRNSSFTRLTEPQKYQIGKYIFDYKLRTINIANTKQKLSPKEAELLKFLCEKMNDFLSREYALQTIWGDDNYFTARSMDVFITKLRKYLRKDPNIKIENIHGSGFSMIVN